MATAYFDNNVYARIAEEDGVRAVSTLRRETGTSVRVSEALMAEALRIADPATRRTRFGAITAVATDYPAPAAFRSTRELVEVARRLRPHWLRRDVDAARVSEFLNLDRNTWRRLKSDPAYVPDGLGVSVGVQTAAVGEVRAGQRRTRTRLRGHVRETLTSEAAEQHWRTTAHVQFIEAMFGKLPSWLYLAYFDARKMEPREVAALFERDASAEDLRMFRMTGLADFFQRRYEVTSGNWMDQGHAQELLETDLLVTRDQSFWRVLNDISSVAVVRAVPVLLSSDSSVVDQLATLLAMGPSPAR